MFFSQTALFEGDRRTTFRVQVRYVSAVNDIIHREWHVDADITRSGLGKSNTLTQMDTTYMAPSGSMILTSASSTTEPGMCVKNGIAAMYLLFEES